METLHTGDKAYVDTFGGLLACKVLSITANTAFATGRVEPNSNVRVDVVLTGPSGKLEQIGYHHGEVIKTWSTNVVPRKAISRRKYSTKIRPYLVAVDA